MSNAINNPVNLRPSKKEVHADDFKVPQKESLKGDITNEDRQESSTIIAPGIANDGDYHAQLAYAEQPVTIRIERSSEKNAPRHADCYVNGKGAEVLIKGKWFSVGYLVCGVPLVTKRKYVEVLMRSRPDDVETEVIEVGDNYLNNVRYQTRQKFPVSIIEDKNPIDPSGFPWAERIMSEH